MTTPNLDREINIYEIHKKQGYLTKDGENYLAEFKAIKQALTIPDVVGRSEQLVCVCGNPSHCTEGNTENCWDCSKPIKAN